MTETDNTMDFLLPELLGKPDGLTTKEQGLVFPAGFNIPADCFIFFIPVDKWKKLTP